MRYSDEIKNDCFLLYKKGLNSKQIAKIMDLPFRTIQEWMKKYDWKNSRAAKDCVGYRKALRLYQKGVTIIDLARIKIAPESTIRRWAKEDNWKEKRKDYNDMVEMKAIKKYLKKIISENVPVAVRRISNDKYIIELLEKSGITNPNKELIELKREILIIKNYIKLQK